MIPLDEYSTTSYEPEVEFVDGLLADRQVGEYRHSLAQSRIAAEVARRENRGYQTVIAFRVRTGEARVRVPDVCVLATAPHARLPHLAIEILSPADDAEQMCAKAAEYVAAGIPYVWIVDPYKRTLIESVGGVLKRPETTVLSTPLVGDVEFADLFAQLDEPAE